VVFLLRPAPLTAQQNLTTVQVGNVSVVAAPAELDAAIGLAESADRPAAWPGLGRRSPPPFRLVLAHDAAALRRLTGGRAPAWGAGITIPGPHFIALRADADPVRTLRHELAHLVLRDAVTEPMPLWFEEGYAVYASGEWDALDALTLDYAVVGGETPGLDSLNRALRGHPLGIGVAYSMAAAAVMDLARRNPTHTLTPMLDHLTEGVPFDSAVLATTGLNPERFDELWQQGVRRRYSLFTWLAAGGAWAILALLLMLGTWWRRRSDRRRRAALDEGWELPPEAEIHAVTALDPTPPDE
jgi:hypothetical protein